jgi:hypothetical protein
MVNIAGYEVNIKKKTVVPVGTVIPKEVQGSFNQYMESMKKATGKSDIDILKDTFNDGWLSVFIEETGANLRIDASQLMKKDDTKKNPIEECIRLRHNFAPVSSCVDYVKQQLIGGGIDVIIKDSKNKNQKSMKEDLDNFIESVYQDSVTIGLDIILPILIDCSLTTGVGAAEIAYITNTSFWDYAEVEEPTKVSIESKDVQIVTYKISEPKWSELKGIKRLKMFPDSYKLFEPQRDTDSMEIEYWNVDDKSKDVVTLVNGQKLRKFNPNNPKAGLYLHNWQLFYLALNREDYGVKGESIILPVYSISVILERILGAVGEGLYRAGNKRFFIVMGSEKRPWGGPFIRNVLQQMKEAREKNWSTIPMPQGFDLKEMGGEVFDAKEVVDYFLKMIAKGMNCPAKTVGVEVREEETYSYQLYKNNLLSAIRNQLFKYHIWAMNGKTKNKQGGGSEDAFIPHPRIRVEELISLKDRIKLFQDLQNVANPINPVTKLKSEIELCKLLGWNDVIEQLPTLEEYAKELEKAKKDMEKKLAEKPQVPPNDNSQDTNPLGEKVQGQPKPQTLQQQENRLKGMQNKGKSAKGQSKDLGGPRMPKIVQESQVEETEEMEEEIEQLPTEPQKIEITLKNETQPQKIEISPIIVKTESSKQEIIIKHDPIQFTSTVKTTLDDIFGEMLKKQTALAESEKERIEKLKDLDNSQNESIKEKALAEIKKIDAEIELKRKDIELLNAEIEKTKSETSATKSAEEENKKTEEEKRKTIAKIDERIDN